LSEITRLFPDRPDEPQVREHPALDLEGLRPSCLACGANLTDDELYVRLRICPRCRFHYHMTARERISVLADEGSFEETSGWIQSMDPLEFSTRLSYRSRVLSDQTRTGLKEAAVTGTCLIGGHPAVTIVLDFGFLGGSMGLVVGEKVALALELAAKKRLPAVAVITSGGARIQEGVLSLMQMAKTVLSLDELHEEGVPLISVLGNPATGQVLASFASQADIIFAEPGASIGFAPYRAIIEAAPRDGDHKYTAEEFFSHGQLDRIIDREQLKHELASVLEYLSPEFKTEATKKVRVTRPKLYQREAWEMVQLSRRPDRPKARDYIERVFSDFVELHGDRLYGDDSSVVTGFARLGAEPVALIAQQKERPAQTGDDGATGDVVGLPAEMRGEVTPEGFRKAARMVHLAARFKMPVISLVDTPGPMLGLEMEHRGLANAISGMIGTMLKAEVPTISVLIGEGGSEAALAFGVADRVLMLQNAIYTPISPEDGAESEMREPEGEKQVARALKLTSLDCLAMHVVDAVVPEPPEGAQASPDEAARMLRRTLILELIELRDESRSGLVKRRRNKYRRMGEYRGRTRGAVRSELRAWRKALRLGLRKRPAVQSATAPEVESGHAAADADMKAADAVSPDATPNGGDIALGTEAAVPEVMANGPDAAPIESEAEKSTGEAGEAEPVALTSHTKRRGRLRAVFLRRDKIKRAEKRASERRTRDDNPPKEQRKKERRKEAQEPAAVGDG
jgi:acyl-CoA carboxylase subunit beta